MKNNFVPYELALEFKALGFDEPCFMAYLGEELYSKCDDVYHLQAKDVLNPLKAPTYSQAFRWFREKYGLCSWITMELGNKSTFCWVLSGEHNSTQYAAYFHTYEEAELACINKLIEIVKHNE
jgi:hypothetical protein